MKKVIIFTAILIFSVLSTVFSDGEEKVKIITLEESIRHALKNSPVAMNAARDEFIAESKIAQVRSGLFPGVVLNASYTRLDELQEIEFGDGKMEFGTLGNYLVKAEVAQTLYSGGKIAAAVRAADKARSYASSDRLEKEAFLVRDVKVAFNNLLLEREVIKVYKISVEQLQSLKKQVEDKYNNGAASEFDLLRAKVSVANEKPLFVAARNSFDIQLAAFIKLINIDNDKIILDGALVYEPIELDIKRFRNAAFHNRPLLMAMKDSVGFKKERVTIAGASLKPDLSFFANYSGANSYQFVSFEDEWEWHWNIGVSLTWNIMDWGLTRGAIKENRLEYEKSLTDYEDIKSYVKLQVQQAYLKLKHSQESIKAGKGSVALAEKALKIAEARYKSGLGDYLEFSEANLALSRAKLLMLRAINSYKNAVAELEYAIGLSIKKIRVSKGERDE